MGASENKGCLVDEGKGESDSSLGGKENERSEMSIGVHR